MNENSDNYSDVDWSDEAGESEDEANRDVTQSQGNNETLHLNIGASTREERDDKKRKRDTVVYTDKDRSDALERHQTDLEEAYYRALLVSKWCNDEFLSAMMISLLPSSLSDLLNQQKNSNVDDLLRVANWFKKSFTKLKDTFLTADEGRDGCCADDLISDVIPHAAGSAHQLTQLLVTLLRALGFEVRYVRAVDPCSFKPNGHEDITSSAKLRAAKKPKPLPGQNGMKGKWAQNVLELTSEAPQKSGKILDQIKESAAVISILKNRVIEILSDDDNEKTELVDENKIFGVKIRKEEIPKCWVEVYLQMPKSQNHKSSVIGGELETKETTSRYNEAGDVSVENEKKIVLDTASNTGNKRVVATKLSRKKNEEMKQMNKIDKSIEDDEALIFKEQNRSKSKVKCDEIVMKNNIKNVEPKQQTNLQNDFRILEESDERTKGRYVQIDLYNGGPKVGSMIDKPKSVENGIRCRRPISYVIAVTESGLVIDVTNRYSSCLSHTKKLRLPQIECWENLIKNSIISSTIYYNKKYKNKIQINTSNSNDKKLLNNLSSPSVIINLELADELDDENEKIQRKYSIQNHNPELSSSFSTSSSSSSSSLKTGVNNEIVCFGGRDKGTGIDKVEILELETKMEIEEFHDTQKESNKEVVREKDKKRDYGRKVVMEIENKNQGERGSEREIEIDSRRLQSREKNRLLQQLLAEQEELKFQTLLEPMPNTISGFKNHPVYVLQRDIKGDRGINPDNKNSVAGAFKDETVYYLSAVEDLKTKHQWKMMMRGIILKDSVSKESTHNAVQKVGERKGEECSSNSFGPDPTAETAKGGGGGEGEKDGRGSERSENNGNNKNNKTDNNDKNNINNSICSSSSSSSSSSSDKNICDCANNNDDDDNREEGGDDGLIMFSLSPGDRDLAPLRESIAPHKIVNRKRGDQEARIELYGAWQTVPYEVESVQNGTIPVNKHGNVEVWDYNELLVPKGARFLQSRHAIKAAESLGLPCAPALVGFENKGQYAVPKIGGAVVLAEHYFLLCEAVGNIQEDKDEKAEGAWEHKMVHRWADLVRKALTRQRLKVQYGH